MSFNVMQILNNLIDSWDLSRLEKDEELSQTKVLLAGWSWKYQRFEIGYFQYKNGSFAFHHRQSGIPHPWKERVKSLVFIGDYRLQFNKCLAAILEKRHGKQTTKTIVDFDYEPVEALNTLLERAASHDGLEAIGGAPQLLKMYSYGNTLPIVVRANKAGHYLLGRRLFDWEKTEYPVLDLSVENPSFIYPLSYVPLPKDFSYIGAGTTDDESDPA
jgi:hypothetical protein